MKGVQPQVAVREVLVADPLGHCAGLGGLGGLEGDAGGVGVVFEAELGPCGGHDVSTVKPNLACSTFSGADAPNVLIPMIAPVRPTQRSQPNVEPFSTDTRAATDGGSTSSR